MSETRTRLKLAKIRIVCGYMYYLIPIFFTLNVVNYIYLGFLPEFKESQALK